MDYVDQKQELVQMVGYNDHMDISIVKMIIHQITTHVHCHDDEQLQTDSQYSHTKTGMEYVTQKEDIVQMDI